MRLKSKSTDPLMEKKKDKVNFSNKKESQSPTIQRVPPNTAIPKLSDLTDNLNNPVDDTGVFREIQPAPSDIVEISASLTPMELPGSDLAQNFKDENIESFLKDSKEKGKSAQERYKEMKTKFLELALKNLESTDAGLTPDPPSFDESSGEPIKRYNFNAPEMKISTDPFSVITSRSYRRPPSTRKIAKSKTISDEDSQISDSSMGISSMFGGDPSTSMVSAMSFPIGVPPSFAPNVGSGSGIQSSPISPSIQRVPVSDMWFDNIEKIQIDRGVKFYDSPDRTTRREIIDIRNMTNTGDVIYNSLGTPIRVGIDKPTKTGNIRTGKKK